MDHSSNIKKIIQEQISALNDLLNDLPIENIINVINLICSIKGKLILTGIGKSGYIAKKIASSFTSTGTGAYFLHPTEAAHGDLGMITKSDIVMLISNSGQTQELLQILQYCQRFNIKTIGICSNENSLLAKNVDYLLKIPKIKESCHLDAPTRSTLITLALGDAIMVSVHEAKGFTKDHYKILHPGGQIGAKLLKVKNIMHTGDSLPISNHDSLMSDVLIEMSSHGFGCVIVVDKQKKILGIITDGDLRRHMNNNLLKTKASDVMTDQPGTISQETFLGEALNIMNSKSITSLIVADNNNIVIGLVHIHDLLRSGIS